ncbi:hypothetical protein D3C85_1807490 [compost metagenome]
MAEKAEEIINPIKTDKIPTQNKDTCGNKRVKGATPKIEIQITYFLPNLSPKGPPIKVPVATAPKKANKYI